MEENSEELSDGILMLPENLNISTKDSIDAHFPIKHPHFKERSKLNLKTALHLDLSKMMLCDTQINVKKPINKTINVVEKKNRIRRFTQKEGDLNIQPKLKLRKIKGSGINFNTIKKKKNEKNNITFNEVNIKKNNNKHQSEIKNDNLGKEKTIKGSEYEFTKKINIKNKTCSCACSIF